MNQTHLWGEGRGKETQVRVRATEGGEKSLWTSPLIKLKLSGQQCAAGRVLIPGAGLDGSSSSLSLSCSMWTVDFLVSAGPAESEVSFPAALLVSSRLRLMCVTSSSTVQPNSVHVSAHCFYWHDYLGSIQKDFLDDEAEVLVFSHVTVFKVMFRVLILMIINSYLEYLDKPTRNNLTLDFHVLGLIFDFFSRYFSPSSPYFSKYIKFSFYCEIFNRPRTFIFLFPVVWSAPVLLIFWFCIYLTTFCLLYVYLFNSHGNIFTLSFDYL